jgi:two-component system response regulator (stage 0 sporulation protein F)
MGMRSEPVSFRADDESRPAERSVDDSRMGQRILLAEDDSSFRYLLAALLRRDGYQVVSVATGVDLMDVLFDSLSKDSPVLGFDLVLSDIRMPGWPGLDALYSLKHVPDMPPLILFTAFGDFETRRRAREIGALALLDKPFDLDELRRWVAKALKT